MLRTLAATGAAAALATAILVGAAESAHAAASYDQQLSADIPIFMINGPDHAGAQEFTTGQSHVSRVSAFLLSNSPTGTLDAQIRTVVSDPSSAVADSRLDIAALGGSGEGWVTFPVDAAVTPGRTYYLVIQASGADGKVDWNGTKTAPVPDALPSWNYDVPYFGGWHSYDTGSAVNTHLAFGVDLPAGDDCAASNSCYKAVPAGELLAATAGLLGNGKTTVGIPPFEAYGATYVANSNVLQLPDGQWRYLPDGANEPVTVPVGDPGAAAQIADSRAWLASGTVPGRTAQERAMAARALLSMRLLTQPNGAAAAAWKPGYEYSWPRDSTFMAVAFARTGHPGYAYRILAYNARTQLADGTWDARTKLDGSGPPDNRHWQLDANGWVPWAIWEWYESAPGADRNQLLRALYPAVQTAADYAAGSLDDRGLPPAEPDYGEVPTSTINIGTAAPLLAGFHAAADLARVTGHPANAQAWDTAAKRLSDGIATYFAPLDYPRTLDGVRGLDSAVTFMAPPYNQAPPNLADTIDTTYQRLLQPGGGVIPYQTHGNSVVYAAETAFFALAWSGTAQPDKADQIIDWLLGHRNLLGELPEEINRAGYTTTVAPLGWTDAVTLLALDQLDGRMVPVPPAPCRLPDQASGLCRDNG
jgi:hypothetical protein